MNLPVRNAHGTLPLSWRSLASPGLLPGAQGPTGAATHAAKTRKRRAGHAPRGIAALKDRDKKLVRGSVLVLMSLMRFL